MKDEERVKFWIWISGESFNPVSRGGTGGETLLQGSELALSELLGEKGGAAYEKGVVVLRPLLRIPDGREGWLSDPIAPPPTTHQLKKGVSKSHRTVGLGPSSWILGSWDPLAMHEGRGRRRGASH